MKSVVVLGSTGSIGTQALEVIAAHPDKLKVVGLAAKGNQRLLQEQAERFSVDRIALYDESDKLPSGIQAISDVACMDQADTVIVSVAGVIGLIPTIEAIKARKDIALASKEVLVAAGELVMPLVREYGVKMTPIDSEHCAIFQCLQGSSPDQVDTLYLTASGGPFRGQKMVDLQNVTVARALNHPTWRMGGKITIDSATLMNKGLETIEAKWLFGIDIDRVQTVIHPQSIVHSFVKFKDGSVLGQMGWPNMKLPILYALLHPERVRNDLQPWSPIETPDLTFEAVDHETFPCVNLAVQSSRAGGTMPCAMNAANEHAANAFIAGKVRFLQIPEIVEYVMERHTPLEPTLDNVLAVDDEARKLASGFLESGAGQ